MTYKEKIEIIYSMQNILKIITSLFFLFTLAVSCSEEEKDCSNVDNRIQQPINPNGDSELALLMRAMFDEAEQIKQQIANGEPIKLNINHEKILTAHATEPKKAASAEYQAFANVYLQTIKNLQTASPTQIGNLYDNMVDNCMTCHKALCPGPMVRIKKLR